MDTPQNADFTLTVPLDRKGKKAIIHIKDMNEDVYNAAKALIDKGKEFDAVRVIIKNLYVGGDDPKLLDGNFIATQSASFQIRELMTPVEGELKKN